MSSYTFNLPTDPKTNVAGLYGGAVNVVVAGRIQTQVDQRLLMRFHTEPLGIRTGYLSFVRGNGFDGADNAVAFAEIQRDPPAGSSADNGIYLGRTGWSLGGEFLIDITIAVRPPVAASPAQAAASDTTLLVTGQSTFVIAGVGPLTYQIAGQLAGAPTLTRDKPLYRLTFDTGAANGSWDTSVARYF